MPRYAPREISLLESGADDFPSVRRCIFPEPLQTFRFVPRAVHGRGALHFSRGLPPRNVVLYEIREAPQPLGLRPAALQHTLEIEVFHGLRELKAQEGIVRVRYGFRWLGKRLAHLLERVDCQLAQIQWRGLRILVVEVFDFTSQVLSFLIQRCDRKTPPAAGHHVKSAIRIPVQHAFDDDGAAGVHDAALLREYNSEFRAGGLCFAHHFLVALLEDMQRNRTSGEHDKLQWKQWEQPGHDVIIVRPRPLQTASNTLNRHAPPINLGTVWSPWEAGRKTHPHPQARGA